jgi:hypothetical protein
LCPGLKNLARVETGDFEGFRDPTDAGGFPPTVKP